MNKEELAALLNGREYRNEITTKEAAEAKTAGLIVVYGASDDLMEFEGVVDEELGAWRGREAVLYKIPKQVKVVINDSEAIRDLEDDYELYKALEAKMARHNIVSIMPGVESQWIVSTALPHAPFDIMEDGELYCRGLVLDVKDLK